MVFRKLNSCPISKARILPFSLSSLAKARKFWRFSCLALKIRSFPLVSRKLNFCPISKARIFPFSLFSGENSEMWIILPITAEKSIIFYGLSKASFFSHFQNSDFSVCIVLSCESSKMLKIFSLSAENSIVFFDFSKAQFLSDSQNSDFPILIVFSSEISPVKFFRPPYHFVKARVILPFSTYSCERLKFHDFLVSYPRAEVSCFILLCCESLRICWSLTFLRKIEFLFSFPVFLAITRVWLWFSCSLFKAGFGFLCFPKLYIFSLLDFCESSNISALSQE